MSSRSQYTEKTGSINLDKIAGFAFDNVAIANGISGTGASIFEDADNVKRMDSCLAHSTHPTISGLYHYNSFGTCMKPSSKTSTTQAPSMCEKEVNCKDDNSDAFAFALSLSQIAKQVVPVGLARDGHMIVGPYNASGELWTCEDRDICNGVFVNNAYAYALSQNFPYTVGCWGPAQEA